MYFILSKTNFNHMNPMTMEFNLKLFKSCFIIIMAITMTMEFNLQLFESCFIIIIFLSLYPNLCDSMWMWIFLKNFIIKFILLKLMPVFFLITVGRNGSGKSNFFYCK